MTREEILAKSRQENKEQDLAANEAGVKAGNAAVIAAAVVAGILFSVQIICGGGANLALWAVVISIMAVYYMAMFAKMRQKIHLLIAVLCTILTLCLSAAHTITVIHNSPALWSDEQMAEITEVVE